MGNSDQAYREVPRGRRLSAAARTSAARLADAAPLFAALGDGTRLKLVTRLCGEGPLSITRLTAGERVTRQAVSKHLRALEKAGLARSSRAGRERLWTLETDRLSDVREYLDQISRQWEAALGRLRAFVETGDS
jgi:DNA-binding transcriptional ArsR family regulator